MSAAAVTSPGPQSAAVEAQFKPAESAERGCPICKGSMAPLYRIERFRPAFSIVRCPRCEFQMQHPPPADLAALYSADYFSGRAEYSYRDERRLQRFDRYVQRARLRSIARFAPPPADFLDVGAAFGSFVSAAAEAGYRARGLDISEYAVAEGRARGLDLQCGELRPGVLAKSSADVITLIEVIEHLPDPQLAMTVLADTLRPGGLLVIQTANFAGRQARRAGAAYHYYLPGHLCYYSLANLRLLLAQHQLKVERVFRPTDFGLLPKLLKSRGSFQSLRDYRRWWNIAAYHWQSLLHFGDWSWTSSMVVYARKQ